MWCACQGVPPLRRSATHGPANSTSTSTTTQMNVTVTVVCANSNASHPAWATRIVKM